ncbi:MAG: MBL fold metallo-hydrolase, partial [Deltaproteobacteria bacterium]|nr:MBL fold metallo-hydrolase [Deltaproteobacteria bacterium]
VKFRLPSGLEIISFPTKNFYGGHWDLGPTWNYVVLADRPFLIDAGRYGQGRHLIDMMEIAGIKPVDLDFVLISHGHEDHDGGLAELVGQTNLRIKAHRVYDLMIRQYPDNAPPGYKRHFPAKCWHCFMPESFYKENCLRYHGVLQALAVERIGDDREELGPGISSLHLPGHSPDCLALNLGGEALIVGDVVLPGITPWPTCMEQYDGVAKILQPIYSNASALFGLKRYLRSLKTLLQIAEQSPHILVLPAHRLYYQNRWNTMELKKRLHELMQHHIQRCAAILKIVGAGSTDADEIARRHFSEILLRGPGKRMAANEIVSHCELMIACGDLQEVKKHRYAATGKNNFEQVILTEI